ncbi:MAG: HEAT repeat domain-containing protein [Candidatus Brocadiia bacterium]
MTRAALLLVALLAPALRCPLRGAETARADPLAVERALEELRSGDWILTWKAMRQLARWEVEEAVPPLQAILEGDGHPWVRGRALVALAELRGDAVLDGALRYAEDGSPPLRAAAVEALGVVGSPRGQEAIAQRLEDPAPEVRYQAVVALARLRGAEAWDVVAPRLAAEDPRMVQHAVRALAHVETAQARQQMIEMLGHDARPARIEAARVLGEARLPGAIPALLERMAKDSEGEVREACEKALAAYPPEALAQPMLDALRGEKTDFYRPALEVLTRRPSPQAADQVAALAREQDERYGPYFEHLFRLLERVDPDRYREVFVHYLGHEKANVRKRAIEGLARCRRADLYAILKPALNDESSSVSHAAFQALRRAARGVPQAGIVAYLAEAVRSSDQRVRRTCLEMIREHVTPGELDRGIEVLDRLLGGKDATERKLAAQALERVSDARGERRIAAAQGYLTDWMGIGPFPNDPHHRAHYVAYFPEREIDFAKTYRGRDFGHGASFRLGDAVCGGDRRKSLILVPPHEEHRGRIVVAYHLELPKAQDLELRFLLALDDPPDDSDGVRLEVHADNARLFQRHVEGGEAWAEASVDLAPLAGRSVALRFVVDPLDTPRDGRTLVAEPRLASGRETALDLLEAAPRAVVTADIPERRTTLQWEPWRVTDIDGLLALYDVLPLPIHHRAAYAVADLQAPREQEVALHLHWDDDLVLWLNGQKVFEKRGRREETVQATLRKGANRLLVKVCNERDAWLLRVRVTDGEGRRVGPLQPLE